MKRMNFKDFRILISRARYEKKNPVLWFFRSLWLYIRRPYARYEFALGACMMWLRNNKGKQLLWLTDTIGYGEVCLSLKKYLANKKRIKMQEET